MKTQTHFFAVTLVLLSFILSGCFTANQNANSDDKRQSSNGAGNASATPAESELPRVLDAKWYQDGDGNAVPDFIEIENGYDPNRDDCDPSSKCGDAATGEDLQTKPVNTLLMLDSSGSMKARVGSVSKIEAAKDAIANYVVSIPARVRLGFLVYGHKGNNQESGKAKSCVGIELLAPIGGVDKAGVGEVMARFQPVGWTPIGAALEKAREAFSTTEGAENHIILVSDGIETCGGDSVAEAKKLHEEGYKVTVDVVAFDVSSNDAAQLRRIAEAGGGKYYDAKTRDDIMDYFKRQGAAFSQTIKASNCYYDAALDSDSCESNLVSKALAKIGDERLHGEEKISPIGETADKWKAFNDFSERIRTLAEQRRERLRPLRERARELRGKGFEINRQTIENYDKVKP
jgi:Mg-chelatase subunit ChlD